MLIALILKWDCKVYDNSKWEINSLHETEITLIIWSSFGSFETEDFLKKSHVAGKKTLSNDLYS